MLLRLLLNAALSRWLDSAAEPKPPQAGPDERPEPAETASVAPCAEWVFPRVQRDAMGSLFEIYLAGHDRGHLEAAAEEALEDVCRLDRQLSHYREDSDISRLNRHAARQWVRLEPALYDLLRRCDAWSSDLNGCFDVTLGGLLRCWGILTGEARIPTPAEIAIALGSTGRTCLEWDDDDHLVHFTAPGVELNLGAVGKGHALDAASQTLRFYGVDRAVLHGGQSTILAVGAPPDSNGWEFALRDPRDSTTEFGQVCLKDQALSTSGSYRQVFSSEGTSFTHILDPHTGQPVHGRLCVWVVAPSAAESDVLSTAFFVMGPTGATDYCDKHPGIRALLVSLADSGDMEVTRIGL